MYPNKHKNPSVIYPQQATLAQSKTNTMTFSQQTKPLTTTKILCQALKLPTNNTILILPVLLISFLASTFIFVFVSLSSNSVSTDITSKSIILASLDPKSPIYASTKAAILEDLKEILGIQVVFIITSYIVSTFVSIATIRAFALTYSGKYPDVRDFLSSLSKGLKKPFITTLYVKLLSMGYFFLVSLVVFIFAFIGHGSIILIVSGASLGLLGLILYLYLAIVWSVSIMISIVEEGCYGLEAISKAGEIIKGRRVQGVMLGLIEFMVTGLIYVIYSLVKAYAIPVHWHLAIGIFYVGISVCLSVFGLAVSMVLYCDCKGIKVGDIGMTTMDGGFMYATVPTVVAGKGDEGMFP